MIEIKGLKESINDDEVYEILTRHINKVLKSCIVFIGNFTDEGVKKSFLEKKVAKTFRKRLCSSRITDDQDRKKTIKSLLDKIYSDQILELDVEEKLVLSKASYAAIEREETVIDKLAMLDNLQLENWMWDRYSIGDTDERRKVLKWVEKNKKIKYPKEILDDKIVMIKERILDVIGQPKMLRFEYPTVINLVFNPNEYNILTSIQ